MQVEGIRDLRSSLPSALPMPPLLWDILYPCPGRWLPRARLPPRQYPQDFTFCPIQNVPPRTQFFLSQSRGCPLPCEELMSCLLHLVTEVTPKASLQGRWDQHRPHFIDSRGLKSRERRKLDHRTAAFHPCHRHALFEHVLGALWGGCWYVPTPQFFHATTAAL